MKKALFVFALLLLSSCGPRGIQYLEVPELPEVALGGPKGLDRSYKSYIYVQEFTDTRETPFFLKHGRHAYEPASSISPVIRDRMAVTLEKKNFVISDTAPIIVDGEVRAWEVKVQDGMQGEAELYVQILDPTGARMFSGTYRGFAFYNKVSLKDKVIKKALARAMGEAVRQVMTDKELMRLLGSF